jgi:cytochrome P450
MRQVLRALWHPEYVEVVKRAAQSAMDRWRRGERIYLRVEMERIALDVTLTAILGLEHGRRRDEVRDLLVDWFGAADDVPSFLLSFAPHMQDVDRMLYAEIARRRREGSRGQDLLSKLVTERDDEGTRLRDDEVRDQLVSLLGAGHDTTATIMTWTFYYLLTEPAVCSRVRDELAKSFRGQPIQPDNLKKNPLPYLSAVLDETMRLHQVLAGVHRRLHRATRIGRYLLPEGVIVAPCIYLAHRRPDVWPDPDRFLPERFMTPDRFPAEQVMTGRKPTKGEYLPFGGGARACIGQVFSITEIKIVVHEVLMRARLRVEPGYRPRAIRRGVTFMPEGGIPATVIAA